MLRAMFPDLPDWPESPRTALLACSSDQTFRVEELVRDSHYVIRAELSGLDPANDIEVTVDGRTLTIYAERWQKDDEPHRTEFRYGPLTPSSGSPPGWTHKTSRPATGRESWRSASRFRRQSRKAAGSRSRTQTSADQARQPKRPRGLRPRRGCTGPRSRPPSHHFRDPPYLHPLVTASVRRPEPPQ